MAKACWAAGYSMFPSHVTAFTGLAQRVHGARAARSWGSRCAPQALLFHAQKHSSSVWAGAAAGREAAWSLLLSHLALESAAQARFLTHFVLEKVYLTSCLKEALRRCF